MARTERYTLLLMRDDGSNRSLRLSRRALIVLLCLLLCLPLLGGGGLWMGWSAFQHKRLNSQYSEGALQELNQARRELQRLRNLAVLLEREDPELLHALLATAPESVPPDALGTATGGTQAPPESAMPIAAHSQRVQPSETGNAVGNNTSIPVTNAAQSALPAGALDSNSTSTTDTTGNAPTATDALSGMAPDSPDSPDANATDPAPAAGLEQNTVDGASPAAILDNGQVRVDNVRLKRTKAHLRVSFGLYNATQELLAGKVLLVLQKEDGTEIPLTVTNDSTIFRISRFKNVLCTTPLPAEEFTKARIVLKVQVNDNLAYQNTYPLED